MDPTTLLSYIESARQRRDQAEQSRQSYEQQAQQYEQQAKSYDDEAEKYRNYAKEDRVYEQQYVDEIQRAQADMDYYLSQATIAEQEAEQARQAALY